MRLSNKLQNYYWNLGQDLLLWGDSIRIKLDKGEFFIDLLFYNVKLHCYFAVELKKWNLSQSLQENYRSIY